MIKNLIKKLIPKHIIYCKDCIYRNTDDCAMYYECDCGVQYSWEIDYDFCSWAKVKNK